MKSPAVVSGAPRLLMLPLLFGRLRRHDAAGPAPARPAQHAASARTFHDAIDLGGRLSIRYQQNGKEESLHGSFMWAQTPATHLSRCCRRSGRRWPPFDITSAAATLAQDRPGTSHGRRCRCLSRGHDGLAAAGRRLARLAARLCDRHQWPAHSSRRRKVQTPSPPATAGASAMPAGRTATHLRRKTVRSASTWAITPQAGDVSIRIVIDRWKAG